MIHVIKLAVGVRDPEHLVEVQRMWAKRRGKPSQRRAYTRRKPTREDVVGGSLYWVIQGLIRCRQEILGLDSAVDDEGQPYCLIKLSPKPVLTIPTPRRPFQGWRYLDPKEAPIDLAPGASAEPPPEEMLKELRDLGLL